MTPRPPAPGSTITVHLRGRSRIVITGRVRQIGHRWWDVAGQRIKPDHVHGWTFIRRTVKSA